MKTPIVIPLSSCGGKFGNNTEFRFALRSIEKHFRGDYEVAVVGKAIPDWADGLVHLYCDQGLKSAVKVAAEAYPAGFFWTYDDVCLLRDMTAQEMMVTPACKGWQNPQTKWSKQLERIRQRLVDEGLEAWDYSRPHGPYWFDKGMVDEGFADWPGMAGKFPWETWILSKRNWPRRHGAVRQYYGKFNGEPGDHAWFMNYADSGNTPELRAYLEARFAEPSRFELPGGGKKVFFIHVPKTAGKSFLAAAGRAAAVESLDRHLPWSDPRVQEAWKKSGRLPVVACVREPLDRALSIYKWFRETDFAIQDEPHRVLSEMFRCMTFSKFWETADVERIASVVKHLRPQASFLKGAPVSHLMRFERVAEDYQALADSLGFENRVLPELNAASIKNPKVSAAARERILAFYMQDYERYYATTNHNG